MNMSTSDENEHKNQFLKISSYKMHFKILLSTNCPPKCVKLTPMTIAMMSQCSAVSWQHSYRHSTHRVKGRRSLIGVLGGRPLLVSPPLLTLRLSLSLPLPVGEMPLEGWEGGEGGEGGEGRGSHRQYTHTAAIYTTITNLVLSWRLRIALKCSGKEWSRISTTYSVACQCTLGSGWHGFLLLTGFSELLVSASLTATGPERTPGPAPPSPTSSVPPVVCVCVCVQ